MAPKFRKSLLILGILALAYIAVVLTNELMYRDDPIEHPSSLQSSDEQRRNALMIAVADLEQRAEHAYSNLPPKESIQELISLAQIYERYLHASENDAQRIARRYRLMITNARLAKLYHDVKDEGGEQQHSDLARKYADDSLRTRFRTNSDVIAFVESLGRR
jgi:hypothetical protein